MPEDFIAWHASRLAKFPVRRGFGRTFKIVRLKPIAEESPSVKLVAALLRKDRESCLSALESEDQDLFSEQMRFDIADVRFCSLLLDRVYEMGMRAMLESDPQRADFLEFLKYGAIAETAAFDHVQPQFFELLRMLDSYRDRICWPQGIALSRTLYPNPRFRIAADFDILVKPDAAMSLLQLLNLNKFSPIIDTPEFCTRRGSGPISCFEDLFLAPSREYEPCEALAFSRPGWPVIEIKFDPLDNGLRMEELDRFWQEATIIRLNDREFQAPGLVDHLLLELAHLHKHGFFGWQWLFDIHLLCLEMNKTPVLWEQLLSRCRKESLEPSAWAGLVLAADRLGAVVPAQVLDRLMPSTSMFDQLLIYTVSTRFVWNLHSLPMLLLNIAVTGNAARKFRVLSETVFPSCKFLSDYYAGGKTTGTLHALVLLWIHWLVLLLPSGITRRTLGRLIWKDSSCFRNNLPTLPRV